MASAIIGRKHVPLVWRFGRSLSQQITIYDLRGLAKLASFDIEEFKLVRRGTAVKDFYDDPEAKSV